MEFLSQNLELILLLGVTGIFLLFGLLVKYLQDKDFLKKEQIDTAQLVTTVAKLVLQKIDFKDDKYNEFIEIFTDVVETALDAARSLTTTNNKDEFKQIVVNASLLALENAHFTFNKKDKEALLGIVDLALMNIKFE